MIDNAKEHAALAASELQQAGDEFERARAIFVEGTGTAARIAELVIEFGDLMNKIHENNRDIVQRIEPTLKLEGTAREDLASVGISNKHPEASSVMEPIGILSLANLKTRLALLRFLETDVALEEYRRDTLEGAMRVGLGTMPLQLSMQDIVTATTQARLSAEAFEETL